MIVFFLTRKTHVYIVMLYIDLLALTGVTETFKIYFRVLIQLSLHGKISIIDNKGRKALFL